MIDLELLTRELGGTWEMWHRIGQVATNGIVMVRYSGGEFSAKTCEHHLIGFSGSAATPQGALANLTNEKDSVRETCVAFRQIRNLLSKVLFWMGENQLMA